MIDNEIVINIDVSESDEIKIEDVVDIGTKDYNKLKNKPTLNGIILEGDLTSEDLNIVAEGISYENEDYPDKYHNVGEALDDLIYTVYYVAPSIKSFTTVPSILDWEIGSTIPKIDFAWSLNKKVLRQTLTEIPLTEGDRSASYDKPISANKTFTLTVADEQKSASASKTFRFMPKVYCGVAEDNGVYDSDFILGLGGSLKTSKVGTYSLNIGNNQFGWISVPKSYGAIKKVNIGGFDTELVDCGIVSLTNASGYTQDYYLYKTPNSNLGSISMVVS